MNIFDSIPFQNYRGSVRILSFSQFVFLEGTFRFLLNSQVLLDLFANFFLDLLGLLVVLLWLEFHFNPWNFV